MGKFENGFPYWVQQNHGNTWQGFEVGRGQDQTNLATPGFSGGSPNEPRIEDWFLPKTPGLPVSAGNPCIGPAYDNGFDPTMPTAIGCYIYNWMLATGNWHGQLPALPTTGWNYNNSDFQQFGLGVRDQWTPNDKLHVDYGVRVSGCTVPVSDTPLAFGLPPTESVTTGRFELEDCARAGNVKRQGRERRAATR